MCRVTENSVPSSAYLIPCLALYQWLPSSCQRFILIIPKMQKIINFQEANLGKIFFLFKISLYVQIFFQKSTILCISASISKNNFWNFSLSKFAKSFIRQAQTACALASYIILSGKCSTFTKSRSSWIKSHFGLHQNSIRLLLKVAICRLINLFDGLKVCFQCRNVCLDGYVFVMRVNFATF